MYDMLELKPFDPCSFGVRLVDSSVKKPLRKIDYVLIIVNDNYVPIDFTIMDIECEPSCPIILGRPFVRTVGVVVDMKEGYIKLQFPLKKEMEHFPRKKIKLPFESVTRGSYSFSLDKTYCILKRNTKRIYLATKLFVAFLYSVTLIVGQVACFIKT